MSSNIAIVILAAGASSRMGTPKQLLNWGDNTLLSHAVKSALATSASDVYVVLGANFNSIEKEIKKFPIAVLKNEEWQLGLGKSIAFASDHMLKFKPETEGMLIVLADQPLIDTNYLNKMMDDFVVDEQQIIATAYNEKKKGVPVLFDRVYFDELTKLRNDKGAQELLKNHEFFVKTLKPPVKNVDLDSKEDYETLHKDHFKSR